MMARRVIVGTTSRSISTCLPLNRPRLTPVMFASGRAMLPTSPVPSGSLAATNTIGMVWVARFADAAPEFPAATMTSTGIAASSAAALANGSASGPANRQ